MAVWSEHCIAASLTYLIAGFFWKCFSCLAFLEHAIPPGHALFLDMLCFWIRSVSELCFFQNIVRYSLQATFYNILLKVFFHPSESS